MSGKKISTFQERIAELVEESGKTQTAIARDFGVSKQTISAWVTGANSPRLPIVYALSYYFGVSIPWLMGYEVERFENQATLTQDEKALLAAYRQADDHAREYAMDMLTAHPREQKKENLA